MSRNLALGRFLRQTRGIGAHQTHHLEAGRTKCRNMHAAAKPCARYQRCNLGVSHRALFSAGRQAKRRPRLSWTRQSAS